MVSVVIVDKLGQTKEVNCADLSKLHTKCKLRKKDNFDARVIWEVGKLYIKLYAKDTGRHTTINKYELPPPIDKEIFYGNMAIVLFNDKECMEPLDLTLENWETIYAKLFGGFEDLDTSDEEGEEEFIPPALRTKQGYSKENGFIADDDEDIAYLSGDDLPSEEEYDFSGDSDIESPKSFHNEEEEEENDKNKEEDDEDDEDSNFEEGEEDGSELEEDEFEN